MASENGRFARFLSALVKSERGCVALISNGSENRKTGNMQQVTFMRADEEPHCAVKTGGDRAVCGNCKNRPENGGPCYVVTYQGPLSAYRAWRRGRYGRGVKRARKPVRYGAYGDPAAMSARDFRRLHERLQPAAWTGYTHQWRARRGLRAWLMASVDSVAEALLAQANGWRWFRIRHAGDPLLPGEIQCPSEKTGGKVKCKDCRLCCGNAKAGAPSVAVVAHGAKAAAF